MSAGIPVWRHLKNGKRKPVVLKRDHVCTKKCLRFSGGSAYCARYSYRTAGEGK